MNELQSYLCGQWTAGAGNDVLLLNPATEKPVGMVRRAQNLGAALAYARDVGGPNLRALSFEARSELLKGLAKAMHEHREALIEVSIANGGNTRGDAKFDIDGATAVLALYQELGEKLGDKKFIVDGDDAPVYHGSKIRAQHVLLARQGVAIQINAFNFPAWGMIGKLAVSLLAGLPAICKPATSSSALAHKIAEIIVEEKLLPEGALQLLMGPVGDLLDHVGPQDVIAFTGSAGTGNIIRQHPQVLAQGVRVNIEADSVNSAIIAQDVERGSELFDLVVRDIAIEMTQKAGQKCTATRRVLVPSSLLADLKEVLLERLTDAAGQAGDPVHKENRLGPLASAGQLADARKGVAHLATNAKIIFGNPERQEFRNVEPGQGYFLEPILLEASAEAALDQAAPFHHHEVFGPVATLLPYDGSVEQAAKIISYGGGSLVSTVYTDDRDYLKQALVSAAPYLGRMVFADEKGARASMSPGCVFACANHGGPGRAGGGAELGGLAGLALYMQRTAIQGPASQLARLLG